MAQKVAYRITGIESVFLYAFTVPADILQFLLKILWLTGVLAIVSEAIGWAISGAVYSIVATSFTTSRVEWSMFASKGGVRNVACFITEFLPLLNLLPGLTLWTFLTIRQSRREDRERAEQSAKIEVSRTSKSLRKGAGMGRGRVGKSKAAATRGGIRGLALKAAKVTPVGRGAALAAGALGGSKGGAVVRKASGATVVRTVAGATPIGRAAVVASTLVDVNQNSPTKKQAPKRNLDDTNTPDSLAA